MKHYNIFILMESFLFLQSFLFTLMYSFGAAFSNLQWPDVGRCSFDASNACFRHLNYMHHRDLWKKKSIFIKSGLMNTLLPKSFCSLEHFASQLTLLNTFYSLTHFTPQHTLHLSTLWSLAHFLITGSLCSIPGSKGCWGGQFTN